MSSLPMSILVGTLVEVEQLLESSGWVQGGLYQNRWDKERQRRAVDYCLMGAVFKIAGDNYEIEDIVFNALLESLEALDFIVDERDLKHSLAQFNDTPGRTKEEVLQLVHDTVERAVSCLGITK